MKLIIAGAAVVAATSILAGSTLAVAQMGIENKNVACVAKCNSEFAANKGARAYELKVCRRCAAHVHGGLPEQVTATLRDEALIIDVALP